MAHVEISGASKAGDASIKVDGHELAGHILAEGFGIDFSPDPHRPHRVTMVIAADTLDVDLPETVVEAVRDDRERVEAAFREAVRRELDTELRFERDQHRTHP